MITHTPVDHASKPVQHYREFPGIPTYLWFELRQLRLEADRYRAEMADESSLVNHPLTTEIYTRVRLEMVVDSIAHLFTAIDQHGDAVEGRLK